MPRGRPKGTILITDAEIKASALRYTSRWNWGKAEPKYYEAARRRDLINSVCAHMHRKSRSVVKWTREALAREAARYPTRGEFQKRSQSAYQAARERGLLTELCGHMHKPPPRIKHTFESCKRIAAEYLTRADFQHGHKSVYEAARKNKWLDDICDHMLPGNMWSMPRFVYRYYFPDTNAVYVGLAVDVERRRKQHIYLGSRVGKYMEFHAFKKNVIGPFPPDKAQKLESNFIERYRSEGMLILNIRPGGSLGGNR